LLPGFFDFVPALELTQKQGRVILVGQEVFPTFFYAWVRIAITAKRKARILSADIRAEKASADLFDAASSFWENQLFFNHSLVERKCGNRFSSPPK